MSRIHSVSSGLANALATTYRNVQSSALAFHVWPRTISSTLHASLILAFAATGRGTLTRGLDGPAAAMGHLITLLGSALLFSMLVDELALRVENLARVDQDRLSPF